MAVALAPVNCMTTTLPNQQSNPDTDVPPQRVKTLHCSNLRCNAHQRRNSGFNNKVSTASQAASGQFEPTVPTPRYSWELAQSDALLLCQGTEA